jgi:fructose-bisphosphate aldolase class I
MRALPTCNRRFAALGIPQIEEARRAYRELIVTTPGLGECVSNVILYDETIRQRRQDGTLCQGPHGRRHYTRHQGRYE